jgi:glycosyltransferase involved in cell wall biosynthesis
VTFISRAWPGLPDSEEEEGVRHIRLKGFDHTRYLPVNLLLDFIWGFRVAGALPEGDIVICNAVTLPVWLRLIKPSAGRVAVMIGRLPKGQVAFYRGVDRIYAPSASVAAEITAGWASERTRTIGYPIDWNLHARAASKVGSPLIVGYAGRLHPEKGIELLVEAARILAKRPGLPDWRLRIVGPSSVNQGGGGKEWFDALKTAAASTSGRRIEWLEPEFDPQRLATLFGSMDIFCYPSLATKGETFGVSIAEAMAARCAVVVSALGCFSDLVDNGSTGLVFDQTGASPAELLADCIGRLMVDPALRLSLAVHGQEQAHHFDYQTVAANILADLALLTGTGAKKQQ